MTRWCSWDRRVCGTPAEPQVHLQSIGSPCSDRSPEASPHQLTTEEPSGSGAATTTKESPMSPADPGRFTNPATAAHPAEPFTPYDLVKNTSGSRMTMPVKAPWRQTHDHPDWSRQQQRAHCGTSAPVRSTTPATALAKQGPPHPATCTGTVQARHPMTSASPARRPRVAAELGQKLMRETDCHRSPHNIGCCEHPPGPTSTCGEHPFRVASRGDHYNTWAAFKIINNYGGIHGGQVS